MIYILFVRYLFVSIFVYLYIYINIKNIYVYIIYMRLAFMRLTNQVDVNVQHRTFHVLVHGCFMGTLFII